VPEVKRESEQDRVYQFLSAQTEPVALARIIAELGIKRWTVTSILHRLLKRGSVEHAGRDAWQIRSAG
jgi:Mn-dependent DtxR family transcriptional regulator